MKYYNVTVNRIFIHNLSNAADYFNLPLPHELKWVEENITISDIPSIHVFSFSMQDMTMLINIYAKLSDSEFKKTIFTIIENLGDYEVKIESPFFYDDFITITIKSLFTLYSVLIDGKDPDSYTEWCKKVAGLIKNTGYLKY